MSIKIFIPTPLRPFVEGQDEVTVSGNTIAEAFANLVEGRDQFKNNIYDSEGNLRKFVNVYLNDDDIRYLQGTDTPIKEGDTISIVPSIAGGL